MKASCVKGDPTDETAERDFRTPEQRQHDGLLALVRSQPGNPELGTHRGLLRHGHRHRHRSTTPGADRARRHRGGILLPIADLIRMVGPRLPLPEPVRRRRWPPSTSAAPSYRHSGSANHVACRGSHMGWTCRVCDATFCWPPTDQGCSVLAGRGCGAVIVIRQRTFVAQF